MLEKGTSGSMWRVAGNTIEILVRQSSTLPSKLKAIESRYELDPAGTCALQGSNHCYICEAWNKQHKRSPAMFQKPISEWKLDTDIQQELDRKTSEERNKLDKEGLAEQKRIVDILKNGYKEHKAVGH